jgi:hypothetical protein
VHKSGYEGSHVLVHRQCPIEPTSCPLCMITGIYTFPCEHYTFSISFGFISFLSFLVSKGVLEQPRTKHNERTKDGFDTESARGQT